MTRAKINKMILLVLSVLVSIVFLLCAYLWDYIEGWMEKPVLLLLICIIGFLPDFLPDGIIGYGLAGTLIGGDRTPAVAISTELFVFFWGVFCARKKQNTFLEKKNFIMAALSFVIS